MSSTLVRRVGVPLAAALTLGALAASPAQAFSSGSSITTGGVTYSVSANSCNVYLNACSYSAGASLSANRSFTHRADVKANGINVSVSISADPSATITGNSTTLATATESGYGRSNSVSGTARPSIFSVSVAARSRLSSGSTSVNSGWTTW